MNKTPERQAAERAVITRYEGWLRLYASANGLPRECLGMWAIEGNLIDAVERGIGADDEDRDLALGIAIARARTGICSFGLASTTDGAHGREKARQIMACVTDKEIKRAAWWLWLTFRSGRFFLRQALRDLNQRWDQMPIVNPLPT